MTRVCASRGVGGSSLQSPGPMCVRLLVCCRRSRVELQRGLGPPGSAQPRLVALLASTRPCAVQYSRTTKQLVGLWARPTRTALVFWLREVGFPRPTLRISRLKSQRTPLMCAQHHDETLRCPVTRHWMAQQDRRIAGIIKLLEFMSQLKCQWPLRRFRRRPTEGLEPPVLGQLTAPPAKR